MPRASPSGAPESLRVFPRSARDAPITLVTPHQAWTHTLVRIPNRMSGKRPGTFVVNCGSKTTLSDPRTQTCLGSALRFGYSC